MLVCRPVEVQIALPAPQRPGARAEGAGWPAGSVDRVQIVRLEPSGAACPNIDAMLSAQALNLGGQCYAMLGSPEFLRPYPDLHFWDPQWRSWPSLDEHDQGYPNG